MYYYGMKYSLETMKSFKDEGRAIDATLGGLVLGRSHSQGGIYFWVKKENFYVLEGEVEGYEYILNFGATNYYSKSTDRFHKYEEHKHDFKEYEPPTHIKLLDTRQPIDAKFLLFEIGGFSIINKYSTKGYLNTIDQMNKTVTFKIVKENLAEYVHHNDEVIEVRFYDQYEGYIPRRASGQK